MQTKKILKLNLELKLNNVLNSAVGRFFRYYYKHSTAPDADTIFELLNSLHSLNDKLKSKLKVDLFDSPYFIALKSLRNFVHHEDEIYSEIRIINQEDIAFTSDLMYLCLIKTDTVEKAINGLDKRRRKVDEATIRSEFKWYDNVVDINPTVFNCAVHVFEKIKSLDIDIQDDCYEEFSDSYAMEEEMGYNHFVTGIISCHPADMEKLRAINFND